MRTWTDVCFALSEGDMQNKGLPGNTINIPLRPSLVPLLVYKTLALVCAVIFA